MRRGRKRPAGGEHAMLKEKTNRWFLALGAALLCAGLGAAALWDLEIDLALYSPGFLPAVLMEAFGWFPQYLPAVVLCVCIALDGARSMPLRAAGGLLAAAASCCIWARTIL